MLGGASAPASGLAGIVAMSGSGALSGSGVLGTLSTLLLLPSGLVNRIPAEPLSGSLLTSSLITGKILGGGLGLGTLIGGSGLGLG